MRPAPHVVAMVVHAGVDPMPALREQWARGRSVLLLGSTLPQAAREHAIRDSRATEVLDSADRAAHTGSSALLRAGDHPPDAGVLIATSGSTGAPRLVELPLDALEASATLGTAAVPFGPGDAWLASLAPQHVGGLMVHVRAAVLGGRAIHGALPRTWSDLKGATHASVVPAQLVRLLEDPSSLPRSLKAVMLGGASSPASLRRAAVARGIPVFTTYGMTETASQVATGPADAVDDGSPVGPPLPGIHVTIDATEPGTAGEIVIEGPVLARAVIADGVRTPLARPHRSRDAGFLDSGGRLHVVGRLDAVINSGGRKIHPETIERVIMSVPGVRCACVAGVPHPRWGQRPVAFVEAADGSARAIVAVLRTGLAAHEIPDALLRMPPDESSLMKPSRVRLAARLAAGERFEELH